MTIEPALISSIPRARPMPTHVAVSLLIVVSFAAGVAFTGFMHEREAAELVCFARTYSEANINEPKE